MVLGTLAEHRRADLRFLQHVHQTEKIRHTTHVVVGKSAEVGS